MKILFQSLRIEGNTSILYSREFELNRAPLYADVLGLAPLGGGLGRLAVHLSSRWEILTQVFHVCTKHPQGGTLQLSAAQGFPENLSQSGWQRLRMFLGLTMEPACSPENNLAALKQGRG